MAAIRSEAVILRPLGPDDDESAWRLRARALRESPEAFGQHPDEHPPLAAYRALQAQRRRTQQQRVIGVFMGDELVGVATVVRSDRRKMRHRADLFGLYVAPEARGSGLGTSLVEAAVRAARELGAERLELTVTAVNVAAIHLYRSAGFEAWGRQPQSLRVYGRDLDEFFMTLPLGDGPEAGVRGS